MTGFISQSLAEIISRVPLVLQTYGVQESARVTGIVYDSRTVQPGNIFVALRGGNMDGHRFIPQAVERGACAVVGMDSLEGLGVPYIRTTDSRLALAWFSAAFYNFPARQMTVIGVTGTDGKTTTSNLIYQILVQNGIRAGIISTINAAIGTEIIDTGFHVTTPEAPDIQRYLARMLNAGLTHVVLETTSHGLSQQRVVGCEYDISVLTNITHEHLDFHKSFEAYREAKFHLFDLMQSSDRKAFCPNKLAVLNRDDPSFSGFADRLAGLHVSYSQETGGDLWAEDIQYSPAGLSFTAVGPSFQQAIHSKLLGDYNVSNILAALAATVVGLKISPEIASRGVAALKGIPGRMESVDLGQPYLALVDFAHTPNALGNALRSARKMTKKRLIAVFGSAGLRDQEKRRLMAETSAKLADVTILTAEDPRTESLDLILEGMAQGARDMGGIEGNHFFRVRDRGEAIRTGVNLAQAGDVLIVCGKGHEQSMCFGEDEFPWDDRTALRSALAESLGVSGPPMPYLPTLDGKG